MNGDVGVSDIGGCGNLFRPTVSSKVDINTAIFIYYILSGWLLNSLSILKTIKQACPRLSPVT
jgi:hypothetical protein